VKKKRAPPPPPPSRKYSSPSPPKKEYVEALYELNGPQDGDLSFHVGDLIEVLEKSEKTEDWWKGRLGSQTGMFPGKIIV
jgi:amphiphysin